MEPAPSTAKLLRALLLPAIFFIALAAYQIGQVPPGARPGKIVAVIVTFVTCAVIVVLTLRKRSSSPENPRLSPFTLLGIAIAAIILALLFRNL
jgi:hypothetical protein